MSLSPALTSGLKGTKESELGVTMGWPDNLSSKGVRHSSHAQNDFVGLPWQPTLRDDAIKFGHDVIRNYRRGETKGSKVAVAAGMQLWGWAEGNHSQQPHQRSHPICQLITEWHSVPAVQFCPLWEAWEWRSH